MEEGAEPHTSEKTRSKGLVDTLVDLDRAIGDFCPSDMHHKYYFYWNS
jgi:hypothetical protein